MRQQPSPQQPSSRLARPQQPLPIEVSIDRVPRGELRDEDLAGPPRRGQIIFQQCGGGRRVVRKKISGE